MQSWLCFLINAIDLLSIRFLRSVLAYEKVFVVLFLIDDLMFFSTFVNVKRLSKQLDGRKKISNYWWRKEEKKKDLNIFWRWIPIDHRHLASFSRKKSDDWLTRRRIHTTATCCISTCSHHRWISLFVVAAFNGVFFFFEKEMNLTVYVCVRVLQKKDVDVWRVFCSSYTYVR